MPKDPHACLSRSWRFRVLTTAITTATTASLACHVGDKKLLLRLLLLRVLALLVLVLVLVITNHAPSPNYTCSIGWAVVAMVASGRPDGDSCIRCKGSGSLSVRAAEVAEAQFP